MIELYSINLISGVMLGIEVAELDDENYLIIDLLILQIIFVW